ncbi:MAG: hypothetical protein KDA22_06945, partial [Phycisphaerales bacterium]|nr:hypothetical protein [Phycisphaerales bacterium]
MPLAFLLAAGLVSWAADAGSVAHLRASTYAASAQHECSVDGLADGGFVVTWSSRKQEDGDAGVYLQRFDHDGIAIGAETRVNLWSRSQQVTPSIAALPSGGAIVVWASFAQDGDAGAIVARRFDAAMRGGDEALVNSTTAGDQHDPVAAVSNAGATLVVWVSDDALDRGSIRGRLAAADGRWQPELTIAEGEGQRRAPSVAAGANDDWIVTWTEQRTPASDPVVCRAKLDGEGAIVSHHELLAEDAYEAAVAAVGAGFVVAWCEPFADGHAVFVQLLDTDGCPAGPPTLAGTGAAATVGAAPDGFVVAWNAEDDGSARIALRRYGVEGAPRGPAALLTAGLPHEQALRAACGTRRIADLGDR